jgi:nitroimidazol reductase NimA-like FMN-containing flavoprotein (pyridoxamine 5'-phosphate oxidase superfamily)
VKKPLQLRKLLKALFLSQPLAVLATQFNGQPYGSLVAFAATEDLRGLVFGTARGTRKFVNIATDPRVAMVMDSRTNQRVDFQRAVAVTATGTVEEVEGTEKDQLLKLYLSKHPHLKRFVMSPRCALLRVNVNTYVIVRRFRKVVTLSMDK